MLGYFKYFIRDQRVATVVPTRRSIVKRICSYLELSGSSNLLEFGPGLGPITKEILKQLPPDADLHAFEINGKLCQALATRIPDPRLSIHHASALKAPELLPPYSLGNIDSIVSGIPLSMLSSEERNCLLSNCHSLLRPEGKLVIYQTIPMLKGMVGYDLKPDLHKFFGRVKYLDVALSIPPLRVYVVSKKS